MNRISKICFYLCLALSAGACTNNPGEGESDAITKAKSIVAPDAACMEVSLTGTLGGPGVGGSLAGAGTLIKYGSNANDCGDVHLQFDTGRATSIRLAELDVNVNKLDAVFITHLHSDHTVGLVDIAQTRWHFFGKSFDLVCAGDHVVSKPIPRTMSCREFGENITAAAERAGEIAQRSGEHKKRASAGPSSIINFVEVAAPLPTTPKVVWSKGDVTVSAIGSVHIPGHLSYRVDSPAGSVVIGGDAGNKVGKPPRESSTSDTVELLSKDVDVLVHSTIHPVFHPDNGSGFPPPIYFRQSTAADLGSLAERAGVDHLMLTHLIPVIDAVSHGPFKVPGGPVSARSYEDAARSTGYKGTVHVGRDLLTIRLPQ